MRAWQTLCCLLPVAVAAADAERIANEMSFGCKNREYYDQLSTVAFEGDIEALKKGLLAGVITGECVVFNKGEAVFLTGTGGMFSARIQIRRSGDLQRYWTTKSAIDTTTGDRSTDRPAAARPVTPAKTNGQIVPANEPFEAMDYIENAAGARCDYKQRTDYENTYFHGNAAGKTGVLEFYKPTCMAATEENQQIINAQIAAWYLPADFKPLTIYPANATQRRGTCAQAANYSGVGIAIEYEIVDNTIVRVRHGNTGACTR